MDICPNVAWVISMFNKGDLASIVNISPLHDGHKQTAESWLARAMFQVASTLYHTHDNFYHVPSFFCMQLWKLREPRDEAKEV